MEGFPGNTPDSAAAAPSSVTITAPLGTQTIAASLAMTSADGALVTLGNTTDIAAGDATGTANAHLRYIAKEAAAILAQLATPAIPAGGTAENYNDGGSPITDNTSHAIVIANATKAHWLLTVMVTNSHATQGTVVKIMAGTNILWIGNCAAVNGGFIAKFDAGVLGTGANVALNIQALTSGASINYSTAGYLL